MTNLGNTHRSKEETHDPGAAIQLPDIQQAQMTTGHFGHSPELTEAARLKKKRRRGDSKKNLQMSRSDPLLLTRQTN